MSRIHHLTPAQQAATAERRARFRKLVAQIAKLPDSERQALAMRCPVVTCEGHGLSAHNQCLVAAQFPTATIVGGFRQWQKQRRYVRKGEHGISIWIPRFPAEDAADATADNATEAPDELRFLVGTVFDVSQTERMSGADVPAMAESEAA